MYGQSGPEFEEGREYERKVQERLREPGIYSWAADRMRAEREE
jgi:hypothetical protein